MKASYLFLSGRATKPEDAIPNSQLIDLSCLILTFFFDRMIICPLRLLRY